MHVIHQLKDLDLKGRRTSVAIGNFDGLHRGHVALIGHMLAHARQCGSVPAVLTFFPHPVEVLRPSQTLERLTTAAEKLSLLEQQGVELVLVAKFDKELACLTPTEFFETFLSRGLGAQSVHVGFNFCFGKDRKGDVGELARLCQVRGLHLHVEPPFEMDGVRVSSSSIRKYIREGDVARAAQLLGRPYAVAGQVTRGDGRGHQIGFPTANLRYPHDKVLPGNGVYVTRAVWQKQTFLSVTNIGVRPTFHAPGSETRPQVEVHVLDFDSRLYDEFIELEICERIREERKFDSVAGLKAQIAADVEFARRWVR